MAAQSANATQHVYETMKEWILSGFLLPGSKIDQDECAGRIGVSRMPIRAALNRLMTEGLVVVTPHRGAIVSPLDPDKLNDLFDTRAQLESAAIILTTTRASTSEILRIRKILEYQEAYNDGSISTILEQNRIFHRAIVQCSGNEVMLNLFDNLWDQCERYRRIYFKVPHSNERVLREHHTIIDLIAERKPQEAADYMTQHTRTSHQALLHTMGQELSPLLYKVVYLGQDGAK